MCDLPRRPRPRTYLAPIASQTFPRCAHRCAARSRHNLLPRLRSAAAAEQQSHPSGCRSRRRCRLVRVQLGRVRQGRVMQEQPASEQLLPRPSAPLGQPLVSPSHLSVRTFPMPRASFLLGRTGPPASAGRVSLRGFGPWTHRLGQPDPRCIGLGLASRVGRHKREAPDNQKQPANGSSCEMVRSLRLDPDQPAAP